MKGAGLAGASGRRDYTGGGLLAAKEIPYRPGAGEILGETEVLRERGVSYPRDGEKEDGGTGMSPLLALLRVSGAGVFLPPLFPLRQGRKRRTGNEDGGQECPPSCERQESRLPSYLVGVGSSCSNV